MIIQIDQIHEIYENFVKKSAKLVYSFIIVYINMNSRKGICCVCYDKKGCWSKKLVPVTAEVTKKINSYINYKYDPNLEAYPTVICKSCQRNVYLLDDPNSSVRSAWLNRISEVEYSIHIINCLSYQFTFVSLVKYFKIYLQIIYYQTI